MLYVGLGMFWLVEEDNIDDYKMYSEFYWLDEDVVKMLNEVW